MTKSNSELASSPSQPEYQSIMVDSIELSTARSAAAAGAEIAKSHFCDLASAGIETKTTNQQYQGIVTKADIESEQAIIAEIRATFHGHSFLAEEEHTNLDRAEDLWIIDPIDGTNNFAHGIPHYAISVAYYRNGIAEAGCVLNPETGDEFYAQRGRGAWHNGNRVSVNHHRKLSDTMLAVGFYYDRGTMMRATLNAVEALFLENIHGIRRMGTAALDIVQVGLGRFGGYFEFQLSPWDFAAARLFLEEAGGKVTTCIGDPLPLETTSLLATNSLLHQPILEIIRKHARNQGSRNE